MYLSLQSAYHFFFFYYMNGVIQQEEAAKVGGEMKRTVVWKTKLNW